MFSLDIIPYAIGFFIESDLNRPRSSNGSYGPLHIILRNSLLLFLLIKYCIASSFVFSRNLVVMLHSITCVWFSISVLHLLHLGSDVLLCILASSAVYRHFVEPS